MDRPRRPLRFMLMALGAIAILALAQFGGQRSRAPATPVARSAHAIVAAQPVAHAALPVHPVARIPRPALQSAMGTRPQAGARIFRDPETGALGGPGSLSPAVVNAGAQQAVEDSSYVVKLPSGAEMLVNAPPDYVIAQIDAHGHRVLRCVADPRQAKAGSAAPAAKPEER